MTCKHEHIQTWRFEDGEVAMWSCVDCAAKFEPIKGWMEQVERKDALLRQALDLVHEAQTYTESPAWSPSMTGDLQMLRLSIAKELAK